MPMHDGGIDFTAPGARRPSAAALGLLLAIAGAIGVFAASGCVKDLPDCGDGTEPDKLKCGVGAEPDAEAPPSCMPGGGPPSEDCGVFVSAAKGDDSAPGTPDKPVKTLKVAVDLAKKQASPVYACGEEFPVTGSLEVPAGTVLFGSLDCDNGWAFPAEGDAPSTRILGAKPGVIPLHLQSGDGRTQIAGVHVIAREGLAPGGSSIAAVVENAKAIFSNCTLEAGDGAAGAAGAPSSPTPADSGASGATGFEACTAIEVQGGLGGVTDCDGVSTAGGNGGTGNPFVGGAGKAGKPNIPQSGLGGAGEAAAACEPGGAGKDGDQGAPGAAGQGLGMLTSTSYTGAVGADGAMGQPGQGGGGGGGSRGGTAPGKCPGVINGGSSGGGGGAGGCGGLGGRGGGPGGASIAVASLGASAETRLVLSQVKLIVGNGGTGGAGAEGQEGGSGGTGGPGAAPPVFASMLKASCNGASGGMGGKGGPGGSGQAGPSAGIAFTGEPPGKANLVFESAAGGSGLEQVKMAGSP